MEDFFFVAVSTRNNLRLCREHSLAGFPRTQSGLWSFTEIRKGDFISFLYGARAYDLYTVVEKEAILDDTTGYPPGWEPPRTSTRKLRADFPYRLTLRPERIFEESLARLEFRYIAENLLQRGGYRKSHFQADRTTLQAVSQMGGRAMGAPPGLTLPSHASFVPHFVRGGKPTVPGSFAFREVLPQTLIRWYLSDTTRCTSLLAALGLNSGSGVLEALGEKAIPEGLIDLLLKDASPAGRSKEFVIEVKRKKATRANLAQLEDYLTILGPNCDGGVLISEPTQRPIQSRIVNLKLAKFWFDTPNTTQPMPADELLAALRLAPV